MKDAVHIHFALNLTKHESGVGERKAVGPSRLPLQLLWGRTSLSKLHKNSSPHRPRTLERLVIAPGVDIVDNFLNSAL